MSDSLRRLICGTVFLTCLTSVIAISAAPVAGAEVKWRIEDGNRGSILAEDEGRPAYSLSPRASTSAGAELPATESPTEAACPVTALPNSGGTSGNERAPNLRNRFGRSVYLIRASELAASGIASGVSFSGIGWSFSTAPGLSGSGPLTVYLENTTDVTNTKSTTWATAITGMTVVHNATTTIPNVIGPFDITFAGGSPFTYAGDGLYVAFDAQYPVGTLSTTTVVWCNTSLANGLLGAQGATAPTTLAASSFRPETRVTPATAILNDASVDFVISYGSLPRDLVGPQMAKAVVTNRGASVLSSLPVTLGVTGANSFTDTQTAPSLAACGGTATVTFAAYSASALGSDTLTVTVPADEIATNNAKSVPVNVTLPLYSYKYPGTSTAGGVGFNGATGAFVSKFTTTPATNVTAVKLEFAAVSATRYRIAIYADSGTGTPGAQLYLDGADRTVAAAGPVTIPLGPVAVGPGNFFVGIQQTNTTNASLGFDAESPVRASSFYFSTTLPPATWTDFAPGNNFKLNVGVVLDAPPAAPSGLVATPGNAHVQLNWNTSVGASSYNVKRALVTGGPYTTIAPGVLTNSYDDTSVSNGTPYFYVVSAVGTEGGESPNSTEATATPQAVADLSVTLIDAPDPVVGLGNLFYIISAYNAGPNSASGVSVLHTLPAGSSLSVLTPNGWSCSTGVGTVTCTQVSLASGASASFYVQVTVGPAGPTLTSTATVSTGSSDPNSGNNTATQQTTVNAVPYADLSLTLTDGGVSSVLWGGSLTYTITVTNGGPDNLTGATVTDSFPAGLTGVSWTCTASGGSSCSAGGSGNISDSAVNLLSLGTATYTATGIVAYGTPTPLTNTATVSSSIHDPATANNSMTINTTVDVDLIFKDGFE